VVMVLSLLTILILVIGAVFSSMMAKTLENDIGGKALAVAKTFASNIELISLVEANDPFGRIQPLAEQVRIDSGASFVVVADKNRRRFSHPDVDLIGKTSKSSDSFPVLEEGKSIASLRLGATGYSIRGKTPVFSMGNKIIGYVSVGYNVQKVSSIITQANLKIVPWIVFVILLGAAGSFWLSKKFKSAIFDLEPEEIASILQQKSTIIETIREGVIACDKDGIVTLINQAALMNLGNANPGDILGKNLTEFFPKEAIEDLLNSGQKHFDLDIHIANEDMIFNVSPMFKNGEQMGLVASFRRKEEMDTLVKELSSVKQYADTLRAQAHEHSNSLHTIAGLIQLESYEEALDLILCEETSYQGLYELLSLSMSDQTISALLIGKYNYAKELEVSFEIDPSSSKVELPESMDRHQLVTIIGNLIDNAFEAVLTNQKGHRKVRIVLDQQLNEFVINMHDSGEGVDSTLGESIFNKGISSKKGERGIGLHLVSNAVAALNGSIKYTTSFMGGACFTVRLPLTR
jgi:two-component system CitB family sensor kinase